MEKQSLVIKFDNAGGIILETNNFCHFYDAMHVLQAAEDTAAILQGESTEFWEGNQPEHRGLFKNQFDEVLSLEDILSIINDDSDDFFGGCSSEMFFKWLKCSSSIGGVE